MLEVEPTGHRYGRRKWPKRFRWEWDGNVNEVIEMGGNCRIGMKNLFPHTSSMNAIEKVV